jgi:hypothetical protein
MTSTWWVLAVVLSAYQAVRGFMFQWLRKEPAEWTEPAWRKVLLLRIPDAILYGGASLSGFVALHLANRLPLWQPAGISPGTATVFVFLAVYGVLGVLGQLPHLMQLGKLPGK